MEDTKTDEAPIAEAGQEPTANESEAQDDFDREAASEANEAAPGSERHGQAGQEEQEQQDEQAEPIGDVERQLAEEYLQMQQAAEQQIREQVEEEMRETLQNKIPIYIEQQVQRQRRLDSMSAEQREAYLQKEEIDKLQKQRWEAEEQNRFILQQIEDEQKERQLQNARNSINNFFKERNVENPYVRISFVNAMNQLLDQGAQGFSYDEVLQQVQERYNKNLQQELNTRSEEEIAMALGEERLAELQRYLLQNPIAKKTASEVGEESFINDEDEDGTNMLRALL